MKISNLFSMYREQISYLFWGTATTAVNFGAYFLCARVFGMGVVPADALAWLISVLFAFWSNKCFVFESKSWKPAVAFGELAKFSGARVFSGFLEVAMMWLGVVILHLYDGAVKLAAAVIVVILNYIFSKLFVFRRKKHG